MSKVLKIDDRAEKLLGILAETYGTKPWNWHTRQTPFQVLIGTVLSQRTRDEKTDEAAKALFSRYPSPEKLASAPEEEIANLIRPANYYNTKALRIKEISKIILEEYSGSTPDTISELMRLPGVGRKTAACVMVYGYRKQALPVDTHVHRISNRIGLIATRTPEESEEELWRVIPERYIMVYNELMVKHGQSICRPIGPKCSSCPIDKFCDSGAKMNIS
ncbi:MAG: endonuclease III [Deltaproteobacteria bacterium]|nr:MAG: endonuclease III [Deltaproteobacteria bacterium]